ncbi:MAG: ATP synthase F1 subunit delta [Alphaproteobacteria bacterium]
MSGRGSYEQRRFAMRYAGALYALAIEKNVLDVVQSDIKGIEEFLVSSEEFVRMGGHPLIEKADKQEAVKALAKKCDFSDLVTDFLGVLVERDRLASVSAICACFNEKIQDENGRIGAEIISASPVEEGALKDIISALEKETERKIDLKKTIDPKILGGIKVKFGSFKDGTFLVDNSLQSKLRRLSLSMKGTA